MNRRCTDESTGIDCLIMPDDKPKTNQEMVAYAIKKAGGLFALARALGIKYQAIQTWKRIPADRVADVAKITGISRKELRPDVFR